MIARNRFSAKLTGESPRQFSVAERISPSLVKWLIACSMTGNHASCKNPTTATTAKSAHRNCTSNNRRHDARAKAATPRGLKGCHALYDFSTEASTVKRSNGARESWEDYSARYSGAMPNYRSCSRWSCCRRRCLRRLLLPLRWRHNDRHRITQLHHVIYQHFHKISSGHLEFHLPEDSYVGRVQGGVLQGEFYFALPQHRGLVGCHEPDSLGELAHPRRPAVEQTQFQRHHRHLGHAKEINHTDEEKISGHFLANFFAQERALQVGQDAGGLHG